MWRAAFETRRRVRTDSVLGNGRASPPSIVLRVLLRRAYLQRAEGCLLCTSRAHSPLTRCDVSVGLNRGSVEFPAPSF